MNVSVRRPHDRSAPAHGDSAQVARVRPAGGLRLRFRSDERLVALIRDGDKTAYEVLIERHKAPLLGFCRQFLGPEERTSDVLDAVLGEAYVAMVADTRPIPVRPTLYRVARRHLLDRHGGASGGAVSGASSEHLTASGRALAVRSAGELLEDVRSLPETQRTALLLRQVDGLSYEHIAEVLEETVPSVKTLLVGARIALAHTAVARGQSASNAPASDLPALHQRS